MLFVLIIIASGYGSQSGAAMQTIPMQSKQHCEAAASSLKEINDHKRTDIYSPPKHYHFADVFCVQQTGPIKQ